MADVSKGLEAFSLIVLLSNLAALTGMHSDYY
jgi:hypothetical protein